MNFLLSVVPWFPLLRGKERSYIHHGDSSLQLCTQASSKTLPTWGLALSALTRWVFTANFDSCCHKRLGPSEFSEVAGCADRVSSRHLLKGRTKKKHFKKCYIPMRVYLVYNWIFAYGQKHHLAWGIVKGASSMRLLYCVVPSWQHFYIKKLLLKWIKYYFENNTFAWLCWWDDWWFNDMISCT